MSTAIVTDKKYSVDPLYQWDQGQVLEIRGLSMETAPEIHFDNGSLSGAIVRQATMDNAGIIRVNIPNSLLEKSNKITAYVCISGVEEFRSLYAIEIMVKARKKPEFYEVIDEYEIYSIEALTREVEQALSEYKDLNGQYEEIVKAIEEDRQILEESIDNYNNVDAKFEELETAIEEIETVIEEQVIETITELETELAKTNYKVDTIIEKGNLGIENTASGEEIHLTDSAEGKIIDLNLYGESQQKQYSGKNLYDEKSLNIAFSHSGVTSTKNANGQLLFSGTATSAINAVMETFTLQAGTYYMSSGTHSGVSARLYNRTSGAFMLNDQKSFTLATESELDIRLQISSGTQVSGTLQMQIEQGSTMTEYEPFVGNQPSPSPNYPQEIESVEISEIKSVGKNKLKNTATDGTTSSGLTFTVKENKSITISGTNSTQIAKLVAEHTLENGEYILSGRHNANCFLRVSGYKSGSWVYITQTSSSDNVKFTMDNSVYSRVLVQCVVLENTSLNNVIIYPMIRLAIDTDATYEPYKESKITLSNPITLRGIGNTKDVLCKQDGVYGVLNGIKQHTFTSIRSSLSSTNTVRLFIDVSDNVGGQLELMCNALQVKNIYDKDESGVMYVPTSKEFVIRLPKSVLTDETTATILKYLQDNVVLHYKCSQTFETLSETDNEQLENLSSFYPITNILNNAYCEMSVKYNADSKNYIDNQLAEMEKAREQTMMSMFLLLPEETQARMIENDVNNLLESEI